MDFADKLNFMDDDCDIEGFPLMEEGTSDVSEKDKMLFAILQELINTNQNYSYSLDKKMGQLYELMLKK